MFFEAHELLQKAGSIVGSQRVLTDSHAIEGYQKDWRGRYCGNALAVFLPNSTEEVSALVQLCRDFKVAIVPQGGNTGLTGGAIASGARPTIIINLSRLNRVREIDIRNNSITVEAGCILANLRSHAEDNNKQFPMLLGSVGSCEVGGLVSTNAGGTGVLRYGNMRDLILGLEVVLPDGNIWHGLKALRKDNTGYDLKQLFIGAEGTLGIVTAAVLKLFPAMTASATAMVAVDSVQQAVDLLRFLQEKIGNRIEAFEIMSKAQLEIVLNHGHGLQAPMSLDSSWYVLIEIADSASDWEPVAQMENALEAAMESGLIFNAVVATDQSKATRIWELRHNVSETNKKAGFTVSNDTSVPISQLSKFVETVTHRINSDFPTATVCHVGHIGDGNIHVIVVLSRAIYKTSDDCENAAALINLIVHEESVVLNGSISAEHGIGKMHVDRLARFKPALDLAMMRSIKNSFDPLNIMNPGKILRG
jgi:FAD/FMN-containing dehydrogenase